MARTTREFDRYAADYDYLLQDPLREAFTGKNSGFFYRRKRDLILAYLQEMKLNVSSSRYLDVGCGRGELLALLQQHFGFSAGCDPSPQMIRSVPGVEIRVQERSGTIPFDSGSFDFVTAVCVYHHVPPAERSALTTEIRRILVPNGTFAIIEHNPYNPVTRVIVSRTPVDADAVLLTPRECRGLVQSAGFSVDASKYFLCFPEYIYDKFKSCEEQLGRFPLGGQFAVFSHAC
jgi:SAM-dependent methyltransferase